MSDPTKLLAALDTAGPRPRHCWRCDTLAAHARAAALPEPPVHEVESWVQRSRRYYGALCRECADWEWSAHWNTRYQAAADNLPERQALDRERQARLTRGRRFWPDARLAAVTRPKTGDCP